MQIIICCIVYSCTAYVQKSSPHLSCLSSANVHILLQYNQTTEEIHTNYTI